MSKTSWAAQIGLGEGDTKLGGKGRNLTWEYEKNTSYEVLKEMGLSGRYLDDWRWSLGKISIVLLEPVISCESRWL